MATRNFYKQLENNLILYDFLINRIGTNKQHFENEILPTLNQFEIQDFIQSSENTKYYIYLIDLGLTIDPRYDKAIVEYTFKIRQSPERKNLSLKYYQYLSLLFTEIYLDLLTTNKQNLLEELNKFKAEKYSNLSNFTEKDLQKIAYWMATGSGKTLISHYNFYQIKKYLKNFNKIILITPNEGLSRQHYEELLKSGINAILYNGNKEILTKEFDVLVIDINKLRLEKEKVSKDDKGKTIFIEEFGNNNILLVDEGHKGKKQEEGTWEKRRAKLSENGFIFEYSATFGQVANQDNIQTFGKSIIFNYSYKRFYQDGYGKDFKIFNIEGKSTFSEEDKTLILTANLLSFYQQLKAYEENKTKEIYYNIEKPLWAVLGSKVIGNSKSKEVEETLSDILFFLNFLKTSIEEGNKLRQNIQKILNGQTGFKDKYGNDVFKEHFSLIEGKNIDEIVKDIYKKVFWDKGKLELYQIKNSDGEIGLKIKEKYFAVINVGNVETLKKKIKEKLNIDIKTDEFSSALFLFSKDPHSTINIVIGAKKFIEGWDSYRVSSMGLIHIGKSEGSQIIQLFGRCVRLKGKNFSLKREPEEIRQKEKWLDILQTAFIFAIGADYLKTFLNIINQEVPEYKELEIDTILNKVEEWENKLITIQSEEDQKENNSIIQITYDSKIAKKTKINLISKLQEIEGISEKEFLNRYINLSYQIKQLKETINFNEIFNQLIDYKIIISKLNISFDIYLLKSLVEKAEYQVLSNKLLEIRTLEDIEKLNQTVLNVAKEYINKFIKEKTSKQRRKTLKPALINKEDPNIIKTIKIKIPFDIYQKNKKEFEKLKDNLKLKQNNKTIPFVFINFHLYNPIPVLKKEGEDVIKTIPTKLNEGERKFIEELEEFLKQNNKKSVYLIRNLPQIGVGFYEESGYYPDFILWYIKENTQHIAFIDPKGFRFSEGKWDENFKMVFNVVKTKIYEKIINDQLKRLNTKVKLHGFFISTSEKIRLYSTISNTLDTTQLEKIGIYFFNNYEKENVEFPLIGISEKYQYLEKIFSRIENEYEFDELLRNLVENFEIDKEYSIKEVIKICKTFLEEDLLKGFIAFLYIKGTNKYKLEEIMTHFANFYIEIHKLERILHEKQEDVKKLLIELGIKEEDVEPIMTEINILNPIFAITLFNLLQNSIHVSKEKVMQVINWIKHIKSDSVDNYTTPDLTITEDTVNR